MISLYTLLYLGTLAIHVVLASYVLAGTGLCALVAVIGRARAGGLAPAADALRDWLPFGVGAAITAGVAPLLFVQVLYQERFYTANLLLFVRWLAVVAVLIAGFYLLYLAKSRPLASGQRTRLATAVAVAAFGCFLFTAWSWAENHMLSLDRAAWPAFYGEGRLFYASPALALRVAMWTAGAVPVMACLVGFQLRGRHDGAARPLAVAALAGTVAAAIAALASAPVRAAALDPAALPYSAGTGVGLAIATAAAAAQAIRRRFSGRTLAAAAIGLGLAVVCVCAVRELARLARFPAAELATRAAAGHTDGAVVFGLFLVINAVAVAWCVRRMV